VLAALEEADADALVLLLPQLGEGRRVRRASVRIAEIRRARSGAFLIGRRLGGHDADPAPRSALRRRGGAVGHEGLLRVPRAARERGLDLVVELRLEDRVRR